MELNDWIDEKGGCDDVAAFLGEKPRTVRSWYRKEKAPRLSSAINIVVRSRAVDYNGIYAPFARCRASAAGS